MPYIYSCRNKDNLYQFEHGALEFEEIKNWRETTLEAFKCPVLFTNGCYDILHPGHIKTFNTMKRKYPLSFLIVGLNSDKSVKKLKGNHRPINGEAIRDFNLMSLAAVDVVFIFDSEEELELLIQAIRPTILFKGGDYSKKAITGAECIKKNGGQVMILDRDPKFSTSDLVTKIGHTYLKEQFGENVLLVKGE